jgi:predicted RNA-binding protein with PUA-like domain
MVDFRALHPLKRPVTLAEIKADARLAHLALLRQSRLSVVPIDAAAWRLISEKGGIKP